MSSSRGDDAGRVLLVQQRGGFLPEVADLCGERQRQAGFGGDVGGQLGVVEFSGPER